jgi:hypothetical protein
MADEAGYGIVRQGWYKPPTNFRLVRMPPCMLLNLSYLNRLAYTGRPNLLKGFLFSVATLGRISDI